MTAKKLMYKKQFEVLSISIMVKNETYRRDFGLSPIGAYLTEFDREYFSGNCDVNIILKNGKVITKNNVSFKDLKLIPFSHNNFDLMDQTQYQSFLDFLNLNLSNRRIRKIKKQICLPTEA